MSSSTKPIFVSVSPNAEKDDIALASKLLLHPWSWKRGNIHQEFAEDLQRFLGIEKVFLFDTGRNALYAILATLNLEKGDEILIQAFTCTAAVNPILWAGAKPVYVDIIPSEYNMSPKDLEKKITKKSRAVIVQHTFGFPARMDEISKIAKKHKLVIIEDAAHALGGEYKGKKIGSFGDAAILSFGRSKIISSGYGGAAVVNNPEIGSKLFSLYENYSFPPNKWICRQLLHPIIFGFVKRFYNKHNLGRIVAFTAKKLGLYSPSVYAAEKRGGRPPVGPSVLPPVLAILGMHQFSKLRKFNEYRKLLANLYEESFKKENGRFILPKIISKSEPTYLYFPLRFKDSDIVDRLIKKGRKQDIYLGAWPGRVVIGPEGTELDKLLYKEGICPKAEENAISSVVLPTSPTTSIEDAKRIIDFVIDKAK